MPYSGRGAPRKHGQKFKLNAPESYPAASEQLEVEDSKLGRIRVTCWSRVHFRNAANREKDILRVEIVEPAGKRRKFKPLWLAWVGESSQLAQLWCKYRQRFSIEHWYCFAKQRRYWTQAKLSCNQACERWSDLMVLMS